MITVDDRPQRRRPDTPARGPHGLWPAVGLAAGLALGWIFGAYGAAPPPSAPSETPGSEPVAAERTESFASRLPGRLDHFSTPGPSHVVTVVVHTADGLRILSWWPYTSRPLDRPLPSASWEVAMDSSGTRWAALRRIGRWPGGVLEVGLREGHATAVVPGVTTFAWHVSEWGLLAFVVEEEGELFLHREDVSTSPAVSEEPVRVDGPLELAAWGDRGFILQSPPWAEEQVVRTLDPSGAPLGELAGARMVLATPEGDLLLARSAPDGTTEHLWADLGLAEMVPTPFSGREVRAVALGPHGDRVAVVRAPEAVPTVEIWTRTGHLADEVTVPLGPGVVPGAVDWTPDGRFLLLGLEEDLVVWELETGRVLSRDLPGGPILVRVGAIADPTDRRPRTARRRRRPAARGRRCERGDPARLSEAATLGASRRATASVRSSTPHLPRKDHL